MQVGEVRVAEDEDFNKFRTACLNHDGWTAAYNKKGIRVWTKKNDVCNFKIVKVNSTFKDISAELMFDVLHDPEYRRVWDDYMIVGEDLCYINVNNDIGYYAARSPPPLRNRDFVTQRSWLENKMAGEYFIINHSVNHASRPITKKFIRGISYMTGYYIIARGSECELFYMSQTDLRGKVPSWVVNKAAHRVAPSIITRLHKVAKAYPAWKAQNSPNWKPWLYPDQQRLPRINWDDVKSMAEVLNSEVIDETRLLDDQHDGSDSSDQVSMNGAE